MKIGFNKRQSLSFVWRAAARMVVITMVLLTACKKDDQVPPKVSLIDPTGGLPTYSYNEGIFVKFTANDDGGIARWGVQLNDASGQIRFWSNYIDVADGPNSIERTYSIPLDDVHWPGGNYRLSVFVVDQSGNEGAAFKTVRYFEAPLKRDKVVVLRNTFPASVIKVDTLVNNTSTTTVSEHTLNFKLAFAGSFHNEVLLAGDTDGKLLFLDGESLMAVNEISYPNPLNGAFFFDIEFSAASQTYYVSCRDGLIREFGKSGQLRGSITVTDNYFPTDLVVGEERIHAVLIPNAGASVTPLLAVYNRVSGALLSSVPIEGIEHKIVPHEGTVILIAHDMVTFEPQLYLQYPQQFNVAGLSWLIGNTRVNSIIPVANGFHAVAHHASGVWLYRFGTNQFFPGSNNGITATQLAFDPLNNHIYAVSHDGIHILNGLNGQLISSIPVNGPSGVVVLMNK